MKIFENVQINKPKSNVFDLSHENKLTCNMGDLIPFLVNEVVPGDKFNVNSEILARFQPMLAPIMHRVDVYTHFFFVPNRLIWDDWEDFIGGGDDGLQSPSLPTLAINSGSSAYFEKGKLPDYMGIPPTDDYTVTEDIEISALPFRAYLKIWNEYYRDQNLQEEITGTTVGVLTQLRKRAWEKDYFTSALPWAQRGEAVGIPFSEEIIVEGDQDHTPVLRKSGTLVAAPIGDLQVNAVGQMKDVTNSSLWIDPNDSLTADLEDSVTINDLRVASRLQEWFEKNARAGSRYIEQILSHFGVRSSDARLQRPEYLGGGKQPMTISEVLSTVEATGAPQGQMTGHGVSVGKSNSFSKSFEEHGHIIGIISIMPRTNYQDGLNKMWLRDDKLDFYWPEFAQLGEQEVNPKELFLDYEAAAPSTPFGYQMRYGEYKYSANRVAGDMRDEFDFWHLGRKFTESQTLNEAFIQCNPTNRIFAVTDPAEDKIIIQIYNRIKAIRPMPFFNVPQL